MTSMMPTALHEQIAAGESQTLEFKASFDKASIESLVASADVQGRAVLVGISQTGKPARTIERWLTQLKDSQHIEFRGVPKTGGYPPQSLGNNIKWPPF